MEKGLAIIEVTDTETKGFYIDQDALECAKLNAQTKKRRNQIAQEQNRAAQIDAHNRAQEYRNRRRAEKAEARRKAYTVSTIKTVIACCGACGGAVWAGMVGLINPVIYIPVSLFSLCAACLRIGEWFGKERK